MSKSEARYYSIHHTTFILLIEQILVLILLELFHLTNTVNTSKRQKVPPVTQVELFACYEWESFPDRTRNTSTGTCSRIRLTDKLIRTKVWNIIWRIENHPIINAILLGNFGLRRGIAGTCR